MPLLPLGQKRIRSASRRLAMRRRRLSETFVPAFFAHPRQDELRVRVALLGRLAIPNLCLFVVLWDTAAVIVTFTKVELRIAFAMLGCLAKPDHSLREVLRHALTLVVRTPNAVLCPSMALLRGLAIPNSGLLVILLDAMPG